MSRTVPSPPPEGATVVVHLDGEMVEHDPDHVEGWDWTDRDRGALAFFGSGCDILRARDAVVTAEVICGP